jgi:integrase
MGQKRRTPKEKTKSKTEDEEEEAMSETKRSSRKAKDRDGLYKRRGYWHFEYIDPLTGKRKSRTTGCKEYNQAKKAKSDFTDQLKGEYDPGNDRLLFTAAADAYIQHREISVAAGTVRLEKERLRALKRVLGKIAPIDLKLKDITINLVRLYQRTRIGEGVSPRTVNMEGQLLRSIAKHHQQWTLDEKYEPLPEPVSEAGRTLTPEEEVRLLDTASSNLRWAVAYHATVLENETGMRGVEIRRLQLKRIDLAAGQIRLLKSKTKGGVRTIELSPDAIKSVKELLARAHTFGATQPDHYLIPAYVARSGQQRDGSAVRVRRYDPTQPTKGWRTAWRKLTVAAGLKGLRGHDLRHNWVTAHAELGTPQSVLEAQAGHLSKRMSDHYKHISEGAAKKAAEELARVKAEQRAEARAKLKPAPLEAEATAVGVSKPVPVHLDSSRQTATLR